MGRTFHWPNILIQAFTEKHLRKNCQDDWGPGFQPRMCMRAIQVRHFTPVLR
jgi:hypothetical protein